MTTPNVFGSIRALAARVRPGRAVTPHNLVDMLPEGWEIDGPHFKDADQYLSKDGANPEAPWPGYGWPLGSECWYYVLDGKGWHLHATGTTVERAAERALRIARADDPARENGAVS